MPIRLSAGDLLVAPPSIIDKRFEKTVMLLTHSNSRGAFALCLNRQTDHSVNDILEPVDDANTVSLDKVPAPTVPKPTSHSVPLTIA